jgi:drug/metabolite transporter (DMT)-like permease
MTGRFGAFAILLLMGTGWGASQSLSKIAVSTGHGHFGLIFWQTVIGVLVLAPIALLRGVWPRLTRGRLVFATVIALVGTVLPNTASFIAYTELPASLMSILIATVPILAFPVALMLGQDRADVMRIAGLGLGLLGVILIAASGGEGGEGASWPLLFVAIAMIAPIFYAVEGNVVAWYGTLGMDAVATMALASLMGALITLPLAWASGQFIDPTAGIGRAEWALIASSVVHALAYASYVWLAARAGAVYAAQSSYIVTATGVFWAMWLLDERLPPIIWLALAVMMAGVALVQPRRGTRLA